MYFAKCLGNLANQNNKAADISGDNIESGTLKLRIEMQQK